MEPMEVATAAPRCEPCRECRYACAVTDEGLCWECSRDEERFMELGGEG